ncbi:Uncharacterised protein [Mycobacteroides abscessus subsp. abscessus]|nr:Uncharacterised protein [Mycobacteroides abscessus subsp. abscessus]
MNKVVFMKQKVMLNQQGNLVSQSSQVDQELPMPLLGLQML